MQAEKDLHSLVLKLIENNVINSAHDISDGGIITALAECCIINQEKMIGAKVNVPVKTREDFSFFSESQSRVIVSVSRENKDRFEEIASKRFTPYTYLGLTGGKNFVINDQYNFSLNLLADLYYNSISKRMNHAIGG